MRQIKFRAWHKKRKNMALNLEIGTIAKENAFMLKSSTDEYVWMQFTGLKDCNGKEIYEGDIVQLFSCKRPVVFKNGCFGYETHHEINPEFSEHIALGKNGHFNWIEDASEKIEVVGNIYENPELLPEPPTK
jgi:uncharacterized phage protein (TIGR01671 family)